MALIKNALATTVTILAASAFFVQPTLADPIPAPLESLTQLTSFSSRRGLDPRAATRVTGGCAEGEVAVGTTKTCSPAPGGICNPGGCSGTDGGCQAELGTVWEHNCGGAELTATIMTEGYCKGGWNGGEFLGGDIGVRCKGDDVEAVTVAAVDGVADTWAKCYKPNEGSCEWTIGIASKYASIDWCCKPNV